MKHYNITFTYEAFCNVDVEAEDELDALEKARELASGFSYVEEVHADIELIGELPPC